MKYVNYRTGQNYCEVEYSTPFVPNQSAAVTGGTQNSILRSHEYSDIDTLPLHTAQLQHKNKNHFSPSQVKYLFYGGIFKFEFPR